jgi:hypothetical protein
MDEKQFKELEKQIGSNMAALFSEKTDEMRAGLLTEDQLKTELEAFAKSEDIEEVNKLIDTKIEEVLVEVKKMQKAEDEKKAKPVDVQFKDQFETSFKAAKEAGKSKFEIELKTNVTTASIASDNQGFDIPGFNAPAHRGLVFEQYFTRFALPSNHHGTVYYTDQTTTTRNAATRNEAAAAPESAVAWTRRSIAMEKILDSIPLTHEAMLDIDGLTAEVMMFIMNNMRLKQDSQMWEGDNAAPNWAGIYAAYATDFTQAIAVGATVDAVDDANIYDLIATIATYISNGKESKYDSNVCFMNPRDILKGRMVKDANGNYVIPPFVSRDGNQVAGTLIVPSAAVTANTLAMGDGRHVRYYDVEGITLEFGLDADDFTKDLITLKGRKRGNLLLKTADATAFYKVTDVDQRITDITA